MSTMERVVLYILEHKFPAFNNQWEPRLMHNWFDMFGKLLRLLTYTPLQKRRGVLDTERPGNGETWI